jgi:hypothetical protein
VLVVSAYPLGGPSLSFNRWLSFLTPVQPNYEQSVLVAVAFNLPIRSPTRPSTAKPTLLGGPAKHVMLYGGARSGKTFVLCYAVLGVVRRHPIRPTSFIATISTICVARLSTTPCRRSPVSAFPPWRCTSTRPTGFICCPTVCQLLKFKSAMQFGTP